jgi:alpha-L-fucosidase 2
MNTLWYTRPASVWQEALPIGNGRLGAMVYGGIRRERIQLNEDTLWGGSPYSPANPNSNQYLSKIQQLIVDGEYDEADRLGTSSFLGLPPRQPAYQTVGDLYIEMHGAPEVIPTTYRRALSLDSASATVDFTHNETTYHRTCLASPDHQVIAISITSSFPKALNLNIFANSPQPRTFVSFEHNNTLERRAWSRRLLDSPRSAWKSILCYQHHLASYGSRIY